MNSTSPYNMIYGLIKYRSLIWQLSKREVVGRYKGSVLGLMWSFFNPLIMLVIYTIVFNTIFQSRWSSGSESKTEFALVLFIGMIMHGVFGEILNRSPGMILSNVAYVKKIVFPLEILPWVLMGATIFHVITSLVVWLLIFLMVNHYIPWTILFLPLIIVPLVLFSMGLSWFIASLGVYLRDIGQITQVITTILLFVSPVFYPIERIPEAFRSFFYINPLTFIITQARDVMMWGKFPDFAGLSILLVFSVLVAWSGYIWFEKTRKGFADVI